ncbi:MAG TPA: hypothetical protein VFY29_21510 [Terriglobia bacterium]|nr:hypothetical protein [Terriglobia bacterium]
MRYLNRAHRVATYCGTAPLALAALIFVSWFVTRRDWLALAGFLLLYAGLASCLAGVIALALAWRKARRSATGPIREILLPLRTTALLLLANVPVAAGMVLAADAIAAQYLIVVFNTVRGEGFSGAHVTAGDCDIDFGYVVPSSVSERFLRAPRDLYTLKFRAIGERMGPIEGEVVALPRQTTITIHGDGTLTSSAVRPITPLELWWSGELDLFHIVTGEAAYWLGQAPCNAP